MNSPDFKLSALQYPPDLPVSARRNEVLRLLQTHQVLIVCGETGSGKTTQLPKMLLEYLQQQIQSQQAVGSKARWIGHTQPRRIAASSVAKRIAQELNTPLGELVGYKVRFADKLTPSTRIKLMTDGILLAETQTDPQLNQYAAIIIDEAHERSLNIDFLLGYLRTILPKRPDLKVIITSATIDADRFAQHFAQGQGISAKPAPVLMVTGRTYPVEIRYRPWDGVAKPNQRKEDADINTAIADAVDELWAGGRPSGDILVFLPGEREIRDAADTLRGHLSSRPLGRSVQVLPLFSRLSMAEQERIFNPDGHPRIVLATNVAETSLTVPGIRFVIDTGLARVKRYSYRNKVEQLLVEPISQAAANQRAGRSGRVAAGICIRLYDEVDFAGRPAFTDPEILRSSLASVILRMQALYLGDVEDFAFLERPSSKAITDGYQLLQELGALSEAKQLTALGRDLAKLPLDPRVGRMLIAAKDQQCLAESLVIASSLSVQDVRDRPLEAQAKADEMQKRFDDARSEFSSLVTLWHWIHQLRGEGDARLTNRQVEQQLRQHFINVRRVREWRDTHQQLQQVATEHRWRINTQPASYEQLHKALLTGLLGNIGYKPQVSVDAAKAGAAQARTAGADGGYQGARGIKFWPHPGAHLSKKPGSWLVAAELVETTRLYGRGLAQIEPQWVESVGAHLLKKQLTDPFWSKKAAQVVASESATLYGITIYSGRRVDYGRIDPVHAREIFIREALVTGEIEGAPPFLAHNQKLAAQVEALEHKARRQDVLVDDELIFAYYDQHLPAHVHSLHSLQSWWRDAAKANPRLLHLSKEELMRHDAAGITTDAFPKTVRLGGVDCTATYLHDPGDAKDGVTVNVPLFVLNQVSEERLDWLVPGMLADKVQALLKSLPQRARSRFVPLPQNAKALADQLIAPEVFAQGSLMDALLKLCKAQSGLALMRADFKQDMLGAHHMMNLRIHDEHGRQLGMGRSLAALKAELGSQARGAFAALAMLKVPSKADSAASGAIQKESSRVLHGASMGGERQNPSVRSSSLNAEHAQHASTRSTQPSHSASAKTDQLDSQTLHTTWDFGELPELLEVRKGAHSMVGFPALVDAGEMLGVRIEVFDEPDVAAQVHAQGLLRLVALHIKDAIKYLDKNLSDFQAQAMLYAPLGSGDELRRQLLQAAMQQAFLQAPLPTDAASFDAKVQQGRGRFNLIAGELSRTSYATLQEFSQVARKLKDLKTAKPLQAAAQDMQQQLERLMPKTFIQQTPTSHLPHLVRYLKAASLRIDKLRADPARDEAKLKELKPYEQRFWQLWQQRLASSHKLPHGIAPVMDERLVQFRWMLEELRVSFFAQELRTKEPISTKRLDKAWVLLQA